jgi:hypothetical protein
MQTEDISGAAAMAGARQTANQILEGDFSFVPEVQSLPTGTDPVAVLAERFGRAPLCFEGQWADLSLAKTDLDDIGELLRPLAPGRVIVRATGPTPGAKPEMTSLSDAPLTQQLNERVLHITALDMQEVDAGYQRLLDAFLQRIAPVIGRTNLNRLEATVGVFIASGQSVVPFHVDFEHNFLIHVLGEKKMHLFPNDDFDILSDQQREFLAKDMSDARYLPYRPDFEQRARMIRLSPGVASYQPPLAPHWVVSSAQGITFSILISLFTSEDLKTRMAHLANRSLRGLGLQPARVGVNPLLDSLKAGGFGLARDVMRYLKPTRMVRGRVVSVRDKPAAAPAR